MICENCLYNKNCQFLLKHKNEEAEECTTFEDKAEWIHLPCGVGDSVWIVYTPKHPAYLSDKGKWFMREDGVQRIILGAKGISIETCNVGTIPAKEIGKKLFFTREAAERVLTERTKKNN